MNNIVTIANVRGYVDTNNGTAMLNAEDVARGWGFTQIKNNAEYVRWETVNGYLKSFGFSQHVGKDDFIPETIVYRLGFKATNKTAEKFQTLLAEEVLPSIRKHGAYMTEETLEQALTNPDFLIQLAQELKQEKQKRLEAEQKNEALAEQNEKNKPKVIFADAVTASSSSILINELAKLIKQNGVDIGGKRLFAWMRKNGYLTLSNLPTQKAMNLDLFEVIERLIVMPDGSIVTKQTTKVTGKGQVYFINKFLKNPNIA